MKKVHGIYLSLAVTTLVVVAGCASSHFHSSRKPADENFESLGANYDQIHPLYAIECASSKFDQIGQAPGGPYGHTFMYLKGACRDTSVAYPKIKVCDTGPDDASKAAFYANPENGVGLALDKTYQNTRYVATDGYDFLVNGDLAPNAPLNTDAFEAAVRKFVADGDGKGVILHAKYMADKKNPVVNKGDPNMSDEEWVAREVIGSSYAVDFARNLGCVAVPINPAMLEAAVNYVNAQNEPFVTGKKQFVWNPVSDQCVQFVHNVFASMGIGKAITTTSGKNFLEQYALKAWDFTTFLIPLVHSQMPAPVNDLDQMDQETNGAKIYTLQEAYENKTVRKNFLKFGRIVATDGVLIWTHDAQGANNPADNQYFNVGAQLTPIDFPIIHPITHTFHNLMKAPNAALIQDNLTSYQAKLQSVITSMDITTDDGNRYPVSPDTQYCELAGGKVKNAGQDFFAFCKQYTAYLLGEQQVAADHMEKLIKLTGTTAAN